jgi:hypothetical protein
MADMNEPKMPMWLPLRSALRLVQWSMGKRRLLSELHREGRVRVFKPGGPNGQTFYNTTDLLRYMGASEIPVYRARVVNASNSRRLLGFSQHTIQHAIERGTLRARRAGREWEIVVSP